jgi:DNA-directed RNA polymerase specialized sigma24 family protein
MFLDEPSMKEPVLRLIRRMTQNFALGQDLLQEALIHLWLTETRRPHQTKSWYLQSAKFHLQHYLTSGRSVDSTKRRWGRLHCEDDFERPEEFPELVDPDDSVISQVTAWDIISLLSARLSPHEKAVLDGLADGLGVREIGRRLDMSHTMVIKHRAKIASLLVKLERPSFLNQRLRRGPGVVEKQANGIKRPDPAKSVNGTKWSPSLKQSNHTNGTTRHDVMPPETGPLGQDLWPIHRPVGPLAEGGAVAVQ